MQMKYPSVMVCYLLFSCNSSDICIMNYAFQTFSSLCSTYLATHVLWILYLNKRALMTLFPKNFLRLSQPLWALLSLASNSPLVAYSSHLSINCLIGYLFMIRILFLLVDYKRRTRDHALDFLSIHG